MNARQNQEIPWVSMKAQESFENKRNLKPYHIAPLSFPNG